MSEIQIQEIADAASVIANGYAMSRDGSNIRIVNLNEEGSAKFFVRADGSTVVQHRGRLTDREIKGIQAFVKVNYREMYQLWAARSQTGFFVG